MSYFGSSNKSHHYKKGCVDFLVLLDCRPSEIKAKLSELNVIGSFYVSIMNNDGRYTTGFVSKDFCYIIPLTVPYTEISDDYYVYGVISF